MRYLNSLPIVVVVTALLATRAYADEPVNEASPQPSSTSTAAPPSPQPDAQPKPDPQPTPPQPTLRDPGFTITIDRTSERQCFEKLYIDGNIDKSKLCGVSDSIPKDERFREPDDYSEYVVDSYDRITITSTGKDTNGRLLPLHKNRFRISVSLGHPKDSGSQTITRQPIIGYSESQKDDIVVKSEQEVVSVRMADYQDLLAYYDRVLVSVTLYDGTATSAEVGRVAVVLRYEADKAEFLSLKNIDLAALTPVLTSRSGSLTFSVNPALAYRASPFSTRPWSFFSIGIIPASMYTVEGERQVLKDGIYTTTSTRISGYAFGAMLSGYGVTLAGLMGIRDGGNDFQLSIGLSIRELAESLNRTYSSSAANRYGVQMFNLPASQFEAR